MMVTEYIRLKNNNIKADAKASQGSSEYRLAQLTAFIPKIAAGIGINAATFKNIYGIDMPQATSADSSWNQSFGNMDSPSGWGD
jgi:hypothetical protein